MNTTSLTIGFPRESGAERRAILTPALARQLTSAGFTVIAEPGLGTGIFINDDEYAAAGAHLTSLDEAWTAPLVLRYKSPDPHDLRRLQPGQNVGAPTAARTPARGLPAEPATRPAWAGSHTAASADTPGNR